MQYQESDLPVTLQDLDELVLEDGTAVRWESSVKAKDILVGEDFMPKATLFPGQNYELTAGGKTYIITAEDTAVRVESK